MPNNNILSSIYQGAPQSLTEQMLQRNLKSMKDYASARSGMADAQTKELALKSAQDAQRTLPQRKALSSAYLGGDQQAGDDLRQIDPATYIKMKDKVDSWDETQRDQVHAKSEEIAKVALSMSPVEWSQQTGKSEQDRQEIIMQGQTMAQILSEKKAQQTQSNADRDFQSSENKRAETVRHNKATEAKQSATQNKPFRQEMSNGRVGLYDTQGNFMRYLKDEEGEDAKTGVSGRAEGVQSRSNQNNRRSDRKEERLTLNQIGDDYRADRKKVHEVSLSLKKVQSLLGQEQTPARDLALKKSVSTLFDTSSRAESEVGAWQNFGSFPEKFAGMISRFTTGKYTQDQVDQLNQIVNDFDSQVVNPSLTEVDRLYTRQAEEFDLDPTLFIRGRDAVPSQQNQLTPEEQAELEQLRSNQ
jgi:hypothetical protein